MPLSFIPKNFGLAVRTDENGLASVSIPIPTDGRFYAKAVAWVGGVTLDGDRVTGQRVVHSNVLVPVVQTMAETRANLPPDTDTLKFINGLWIPKPEAAQFEPVVDGRTIPGTPAAPLPPGTLSLAFDIQLGVPAQKWCYANFYWGVLS